MRGGYWSCVECSLQEGADFGFTVAAVAADGADGVQFPVFRPAGHGFRVDTEDRGDFGGCEQGFRLRPGGVWCHNKEYAPPGVAMLL